MFHCEEEVEAYKAETLESMAHLGSSSSTRGIDTSSLDTQSERVRIPGPNCPKFCPCFDFQEDDNHGVVLVPAP